MKHLSTLLMLERRLPLLQRTQQMAALKKLFAPPSSE